jgi:hypothetical protein
MVNSLYPMPRPVIQIAHPSHSTPQISVTYQGWDASKTVLDGQLCGHVGPGAGRGAHCRAQAAAVLALEFVPVEEHAE